MGQRLFSEILKVNKIFSKLGSYLDLIQYQEMKIIKRKMEQLNPENLRKIKIENAGKKESMDSTSQKISEDKSIFLN